MSELLLPPAQADSVRRILWAHLPSGARVSVFGSRATGRRFKPHSDVDLLIDRPVELPLIALPLRHDPPRQNPANDNFKSDSVDA